MLEINGHMSDVATAKDGTLSIATNEGEPTAKAAISEDGLQPVNFVMDNTEDNGTTRTDSYEHEFSSRAQLAARIAREKAEERAELAELEPLTEESAKQQRKMLESMDAEAGQAEEGDQQEQPANDFTPEEVAQIRQQAVADAIAAGRQAVQAQNPELVQQQYIQAQQAVLADYNQKLEQTKAMHPDFDEVIKRGEQVQLSQPKIEALLAIGGPEVVYKLAKNLPEAQRLAAMPDHLAVAEIGRLAAQVNTNNKPQPTQQRKAISVMRPVSGGSIKAAPDLSDPNISYADYKRVREKQIRHRYDGR